MAKDVRPQITVTTKDAGFGAFCNSCQPEENRYMRFAHTFSCRVVKVKNEHGTNSIFLCDRCVDGMVTEANKMDMYDIEVQVENGS